MIQALIVGYDRILALSTMGYMDYQKTIDSALLRRFFQNVENMSITIPSDHRQFTSNYLT
jgi:hypothetical protein